MKNQLIGLVAGFLICTAAVMADTFPNTLWIGNDGTAAAPILNTTTTGVVLRQINSTAANGLAIDSNKLYVNSLSGGNFYNLDTLTTNPGDTFSLPHPSFDMTFFGGFLWTASFGTGTIDKVDPATGLLAGGFAVGFIPLGVTTDGAGRFWVSGADDVTGQQVLRHFNASFQPDANIDTTDIVSGLGGLGFDPRDNTLFIGTLGKVFHYDTIGNGTDLGFFSLPDQSQFVNGLEFDPGATAVPEPTSILLLGTIALAVAGIQRRLRARQ
jgi:hypothetical protein